MCTSQGGRLAHIVGILTQYRTSRAVVNVCGLSTNMVIKNYKHEFSSLSNAIVGEIQLCSLAIITASRLHS
uniref:Ovule protein n=1 Tax=Ascaris lumbricoides TaxID=6252 RepID=A0A0M3HGY3_ASCLU